MYTGYRGVGRLLLSMLEKKARASASPARDDCISDIVISAVYEEWIQSVKVDKTVP